MISNEHEDEDGGLTYRDLKEPEGWRVSSLRKILLLRFSGLFLGWEGGMGKWGFVSESAAAYLGA